MYRECRSRSGSDPQDINEQEEPGKAACSHLSFWLFHDFVGTRGTTHVVLNCHFKLVAIPNNCLVTPIHQMVKPKRHMRKPSVLAGDSRELNCYC